MSSQVCIHDTSDSGHTLSNLFTTGSDGSSCDAFSEILRLNTSTPNSSIIEKTSQFGDCQSQGGPGSDGGSSSGNNSTRSTCCTNLRWSSSSTTTETGGYVSCNTSLDGDGNNSVYTSQSMMIPSSSSCNNPYLQNYDVPRNSSSVRDMRSFASDSNRIKTTTKPAVNGLQQQNSIHNEIHSDNSQNYENSQVVLQHLQQQELQEPMTAVPSASFTTSSSCFSSHLPSSSSNDLSLGTRSSSSLVNTSSCHHNSHHTVPATITVTNNSQGLPSHHHHHHHVVSLSSTSSPQQQDHYQVPRTALTNLYLKVSFLLFAKTLEMSSHVYSTINLWISNILLHVFLVASG